MSSQVSSVGGSSGGILPPGEKPVIKGKYCHMLKEDVAVWTAFLNWGGLDLDEVWYDVHVGRAMRVPDGQPEWMYAVAGGVSRKRIDVVARGGRAWWIIEVKPNGSMAALGQAITYSDLFRREFLYDGRIWPCVVCGQADADVLQTAKRLGVQIFALEGVLL